MLPVMRPESVIQPQVIRPFLILKLKEGWTFDRARRLFTSSKGRSFSMKQKLPRGSRIVPMAQGLSNANPRSLSKAERNLSRYLQLVLPVQEDPSAYLSQVAIWDCISEVKLPPRISLPQVGHSPIKA